MSNDNLNQDIDMELQDEIVENSVEVSSEELEEGKDAMVQAEIPKANAVTPKEVDGAKAAADDAATIKKSAPAKATPPKTKAGMINAMSMKMHKMKKEQLTAAYNAMHKEGYEADDEAIAEGTFDEDLKALVDSEATLSEGFKDKAEIIFEAALKSKLSEEIDRLEESYKEELAEETDRIQSELVEKVDGYLNYVVEQWMEDNKLAVESGLRAEIAESFMQSLQNVFEEHYIEVPESKVDLVDEMTKKIEDLEEQVNEATQANIELYAEHKELVRESIVRDAAVGLSEAQAEKLKSLAEDVDFDDVDAFIEKVETIKESYFKEKTEVVTEDVDATASEGEEEISYSDSMARYLQAIKNSSSN
jgi:hypothetical protein